jgi:crossover junction endodeoxyribonuclease RuvC
MGLGLVEVVGDDLKCLHSDSIRMGQREIADRLGIIFDAVARKVDQYRPDIVAVEQVFVAHNAKSALILGHARGSAICAAVNRSVPVAEYSARQIKLAVVGSGAATKEQVQHMVRVLLGMTVTPRPDAADALACAICHINTRQVAGRVEMNGEVQ